MTLYDNNNPETFNGAPKLEIAAHRFSVVRKGVETLIQVVGVGQASNSGNITQNYGVTGDVMLRPASSNIPENVIVETKQLAVSVAVPPTELSDNELDELRKNVLEAHNQGNDQTALRQDKDAEAEIISLAKLRDNSGETYAQKVA